MNTYIAIYSFSGTVTPMQYAMEADSFEDALKQIAEGLATLPKDEHTELYSLTLKI